mmetsp:Transcript_11546/g.25310  ORF Transcript_11546/g.25310 Transcript_11546/m.25310 type:complete len:100 (-) Transcript_11546:1329-1628(-)
MALVESDLLLYLSYMKPKEVAQVDTINAYGGTAGWHPRLYNEHKQRLLAAAKVTDTKSLKPEEMKAIQDKAKKESCEEYLACFLLGWQTMAAIRALKLL